MKCSIRIGDGSIEHVEGAMLPELGKSAGLRFFVHKTENCYTVTEASTGFAFTHGATKEDAINKAEIDYKKRESVIKEHVEAIIKKYGEMPRRGFFI